MGISDTLECDWALDDAAQCEHDDGYEGWTEGDEEECPAIWMCGGLEVLANRVDRTRTGRPAELCVSPATGYTTKSLRHFLVVLSFAFKRVVLYFRIAVATSRKSTTSGFVLLTHHHR